MTQRPLYGGPVATYGGVAGTQAGPAGPRVQLRRALAGMSYEQQLAAVAPPAAATQRTPSAAAAAVDGGLPGTAPVQMADDGTPGNNQEQNKQFRGAVREIGRRIGRQLSRAEERQLHDEITGQNMGYHEIVETGVSMFGGGEDE